MIIRNYYGSGVDVRSNPSVFKDLVIPEGSIARVNEITKSRKPFVMRIYDRQDGIPISITGKNYVVITPGSSPTKKYSFTLLPGSVCIVVLSLKLQDEEKCYFTFLWCFFFAFYFLLLRK